MDVLSRIAKKNKGNLENKDNRTVLHNCLKTDMTVEPLKAIEAHYLLVPIHPFADGNGRAARLMMNLMSPLIILLRNQKRYLSALETYQTTDNKYPYFNFMLEALSRSLRAAID